jgi:hypothetical protein
MSETQIETEYGSFFLAVVCMQNYTVHTFSVALSYKINLSFKATGIQILYPLLQ